MDEVSQNQVSVATMQLGISDILGEDVWENKNRPNECHIVIDTGFNGCGLRSFDWLGNMPRIWKVIIIIQNWLKQWSWNWDLSSGISKDGYQ